MQVPAPSEVPREGAAVHQTTSFRLAPFARLGRRRRRGRPVGSLRPDEDWPREECGGWSAAASARLPREPRVRRAPRLCTKGDDVAELRGRQRGLQRVRLHRRAVGPVGMPRLGVRGAALRSHLVVPCRAQRSVELQHGWRRGSAKARLLLPHQLEQRVARHRIDLCLAREELLELVPLGDAAEVGVPLQPQHIRHHRVGPPRGRGSPRRCDQLQLDAEPTDEVRRHLRHEREGIRSEAVKSPARQLQPDGVAEHAQRQLRRQCSACCTLSLCDA
mmetsp:Transcript_41628/g.134981  ORF Transcript_41628/g.134981 Transcript_41628/m.134981 type:complete len:275 (-) Transcript_41628:171-995(-)